MSDEHLGLNTTVTIQSHEETIPALPKLGQALSKLAIEVPLPKVPLSQQPGDNDGDEPNDDEQPHFIQDATVLSALMQAVYLDEH